MQEEGRHGEDETGAQPVDGAEGEEEQAFPGLLRPVGEPGVGQLDQEADERIVKEQGERHSHSDTSRPVCVGEKSFMQKIEKTVDDRRGTVLY